MFDSLDTAALAKIRADIAPNNGHADEYAMSAVTLMRTLVDEELAKRPTEAPPTIGHLPSHPAGEDDHPAAKKK